MVYYISDEHGDCMVSYDNRPTIDLDNAIKFETYSECEDFLKKITPSWDSKLCICSFDPSELDIPF